MNAFYARVQKRPGHEGKADKPSQQWKPVAFVSGRTHEHQSQRQTQHACRCLNHEMEDRRSGTHHPEQAGDQCERTDREGFPVPARHFPNRPACPCGLGAVRPRCS